MQRVLDTKTIDTDRAIIERKKSRRITLPVETGSSKGRTDHLRPEKEGGVREGTHPQVKRKHCTLALIPTEFVAIFARARHL